MKLKHRITLQTYYPDTEERNSRTEDFCFVIVESDYDGAITLAEAMLQHSDAEYYSVSEEKEKQDEI